jgi:hypothetical protein
MTHEEMRQVRIMVTEATEQALIKIFVEQRLKFGTRADCERIADQIGNNVAIRIISLITPQKGHTL